MLHSPEYALRMRHHHREATIRCGDRRDTQGRSVGIERVALGLLTVVIHKTQCYLYFCQITGVRKIRKSLAMGHRNRCARTSHASEENRWQGRNAGGWSSAVYDDLQARTSTLLDPAARQEGQFQLLKMLAEEVPFVPMYYNPVGVAMRKGVVGVTEKSHTPFLALATSWNIEAWDLK